MPQPKDKELRLKVEEFTYCKEATDEAMQFISDLLAAERQRVIEEAVHFAEQYILDSKVGHPQKVILSKNLYRVALKHDIRVGTT